MCQTNWFGGRAGSCNVDVAACYSEMLSCPSTRGICSRMVKTLCCNRLKRHDHQCGLGKGRMAIQTYNIL